MAIWGFFQVFVLSKFEYSITRSAQTSRCKKAVLAKASAVAARVRP